MPVTTSAMPPSLTGAVVSSISPTRLNPSDYFLKSPPRPQTTARRPEPQIVNMAAILVAAVHLAMPLFGRQFRR